MKIAFCCLPALILSASASAGAVIYTDSKHPVPDGQNAPVVFLDAQEHVHVSIPLNRAIHF